MRFGFVRAPSIPSLSVATIVEESGPPFFPYKNQSPAVCAPFVRFFESGLEFFGEEGVRAR